MNNKQIETENNVVLEFQDNTTPPARFEEYVRLSQQTNSENVDIKKI